MLLSTTVHIKNNNPYKDCLYHLCYHAARMYNFGLYSVRQHFFNTNSYLNYYGNYHVCKDNENYKILLCDTGQQVLRLVDRNMRSFFSLLKMKSLGKYTEKVKLPRYKDKEGLMMFSVQGRSVRIHGKKACIGLTKEFREKYNVDFRFIEIKIPKKLRHISAFNELRVLPLHNGLDFKVEFIYDSANLRFEQVKGNGNNFLSIDLGISNLMSCFITSNGRSHQFIIDGRPLKSINAYYNKMKAALQASYSKDKDIKGLDTKRFVRLSNGRDNRINDYFNKAVQYLIQVCLRYDIGTVVLGYNEGWKQEVELGKVLDQSFVCIPFLKLRQKLQCKCELHGIAFVNQEESYTSNASSLDLDGIPTYGKEEGKDVTFSGKRINRGLYKSKEGLLLNADINGSVNILRKYLQGKGKDLSSDSVRALVNVPCRKVNTFRSSPFL